MTGPQLQAAFDAEAQTVEFTGLAAAIRHKQRRIARREARWQRFEPFAFIAYLLLFAFAAGGAFTPLLLALFAGRHP